MAYQGYAAPILVGTDGLTGSQNLDALSPGQLLQRSEERRVGKECRL